MFNLCRTERQVRRELAKDKDTKQETDVKEKDSKEKDAKKKAGHTHHRRISSGASHAPKVEEDQYGAAQLFLPDNAPKEKKGGVSSPLKTKKVGRHVGTLRLAVVRCNLCPAPSVCRWRLSVVACVLDLAVKSRPRPPRCTVARSA